MALTANDVRQIQPGRFIQFRINGSPWSAPRKVASLFADGVTYDGRRFVCGYTEFGENSQISFSCSEGETLYRLVPTDRSCMDCGSETNVLGGICDDCYEQVDAAVAEFIRTQEVN